MKLISDQVTEREIGIILGALEKVVKNNVDGDIVEFGCYVGTTSLFMSEYLKSTQSNKKLHVYDSFAGLPEKLSYDSSPAGEQFVKGELAATKAQLINNYRKHNLPLPIIHKAWFEDLSGDDLPVKIAFAFLDGDYYSSIATSLRLIWTKLQTGSVVIIDDYANEALPGASRAINEWAKLKRLDIMNIAGMAVIQL